MTAIRSVASRDIDPRAELDAARIGFVLWSGAYGGAETWSLALAHALVRRGFGVGVFAVGRPEPLLTPESTRGMLLDSMGLSRGREILWHPTAFARGTARVAPDVAIVPSAGFLSGALRAGGYRGRVIAIEHGSLRNLRSAPWPARAVRLASELGGIWAVDAQVAPSDFMVDELKRYPHARIVRRIYPGLDWKTYGKQGPVASCAPSAGGPLLVGFAGRLIRGKGVETLLRGLAACRPEIPIRLRIAGDGPERPRLEELAAALGISDRVEFLGWVHDMSAFWRSVALAVVPSHEWEESFGMVAAEAMASGLPVIASRNGGLTEVVEAGRTGMLFPPGDWRQLAGLLDRYASEPDLLAAHSRSARLHCEEKFNIDRCAEEFGELIGSILQAGRSEIRPGAHR